MIIMKKIWIAGLSLAGILAVSGTAAALTSGHTAGPSGLHTSSFTPASAATSRYSSSGGASRSIVPAVAAGADTPTAAAAAAQSTAVTQSPSSAAALPPGKSTPPVPENSGVAPTPPSVPSAGNQYPYGPGMMGGYGSANGSWGYGMMGGYRASGSADGSWGYGMMGGLFHGANYSSAFTDQTDATNDIKASLVNATVDKSANTITYAGSSVKIVMLGGPQNADGKFVIDGLINPTLNIPEGANVTLEFINQDSGMPHGVEITTATPPYAYMSMMQGGIYPGAFIQPLPPATAAKYPAVTTSFNAKQAGTFYYICQFPGHAEKGMYGKIVIH
ncbi:Cupredoxin [Acididesulfobacillus acetoxydans]|uniref:Cupredoxin n=2 Tax=Acididesulfobacillus acetoxydans TaxID=1561005 RepID=A0A8S0XVL6_9FIRM|nr:Cupredoxin [Acididesulfobacillus acetoxydans]CEJ06581.1 rusticyanin [Acididesulfobacillus acetoxydans]